MFLLLSNFSFYTCSSIRHKILKTIINKLPVREIRIGSLVHQKALTYARKALTIFQKALTIFRKALTF